MNRRRTYEISILGIFTAFLILQAYIPMFGYIRIIPGMPAITTIHLTVIIGAIVLGTRDGAILGLIWGLISLLKAYTTPSDPLTLLIFTNPVIAILPRVLVGVVAAQVYKGLHHIKGLKRIDMSVAAGCATLTNTALVILLTWVFYSVPAANLFKTNPNRLLIVMTSALGVNAIFEILLAVIVVPLVALPLINLKRKA